MKKSTTKLAILLSLGLGFSMTAGIAKAASPVSIRVIAQTGGPGTALKDAAAVYNKSHPNVTVSVDLFDYDPTRQRTVLSYASGKNTYDVLGFDYAWEKQYVDSGYLIPLGDMAAKQAPLIHMKDFIPSYVSWATISGKQYALPWFGAVYMLYYRTDLLKQAGVAVPKTWEEYASAAATLKKKLSMPGTTLIGKRDDPLLDEFWSVAWSYGASITTPDLKTSLVNSPKALQAFTVWKKVLASAPQDALAADWPAAAATFSAGKSAMMLNFSDTSDSLIAPGSKVAGKVGFAAIPSGPTGKSTPNLGGWGLGVSAKSKNVQAAFDFIAWATSAEQQKAGLINGGSANRISVLSDKTLQAKYPYYAAALVNYKNAIYFPNTSHWVDWEAAMAPPLSSALSGQISASAAVKQSSDRLIAEIKKEK